MIETANKNQHSKGENMENFTLNGTAYSTDQETLNVIKSVMPTAKINNDSTAVQAIIFLGLSSGRVKKI
jgi:hypothetical protein